MKAKPNKRSIVPLSIDSELMRRIEAAQKRRSTAQPKKAQVMRELIRIGLEADEQGR